MIYPWQSAVEMLALVLMRCSAFFQEEDLSGLGCGRWSRFAPTGMRTASDLRAVPSPPHYNSKVLIVRNTKTARQSKLFARPTTKFFSFVMGGFNQDVDQIFSPTNVKNNLKLVWNNNNNSLIMNINLIVSG